MPRARKSKALVEAERTIASLRTDLETAETRLKAAKSIAEGQLRALGDVREAIDKLEDGSHYSNRSSSLTDRIHSLGSHWQSENTRVLSRDKSERQDMIVFLRAMVMTVDGATHAGTHREKDARLRGIIDVAEHAIRQLRDHENSFYSHWGRSYPDVFRSDYPVREILDKLRGLERENEDLRDQIQADAESKGESTPLSNARLVDGEEHPF